MARRQQILTLSLCGALIFWTYSGCLTSFMAISVTDPTYSLKDLLLFPSIKLYVKAESSGYGQTVKWAEENNQQIDGILNAYIDLDITISKMMKTTSELVLVPKSTFISQLDESSE